MKMHSPKTGIIASGNQALTASYVVIGGIIAGQARDQIIVMLDYTKGDETDLRMKVDFMSEAATAASRFQEAAASTDANGLCSVTLKEYKFTATGKYRIAIPSYGHYFEVSFKATGGTPTGTFNADFRLDNIDR